MEDQAPRHDAQNPAVRFIRWWMKPTPRREIAVWVFLILVTAGIRVYLSHLVPADATGVTDKTWIDAVRPTYNGEIVVARDLMEIAL